VITNFFLAVLFFMPFSTFNSNTFADTEENYSTFVHNALGSF
jgi:hypothetical protein